MKKIAIAKIADLSREQWLTLRKRGIGGSDAAIACGLSRWKSPLDLYLDKTSPDTEEQGNEAMYWGTVMEPVLRSEFSKRTGLKVDSVPFMFSCQEYPFMMANIDGIVHEADGSTALLELKTANGFADKDWEDGPPAEYYLQIQHYLAVVDLPKAYVAVLIGGNHFQYESIDRDEETIRTIIALEQDFWHNHILAKVPPAADANSAGALDKMYPASNGTSVILPAEADTLIKNLIEIKILETNLKKSKVDSENQLKALMKEAECANTTSGYSVRWKNSRSSRLDSTRLKKEQPELVAQYTVTSNYRRFTITEPKGDH